MICNAIGSMARMGEYDATAAAAMELSRTELPRRHRQGALPTAKLASSLYIWQAKKAVRLSILCLHPA
jgi:hypothetical protein